TDVSAGKWVRLNDGANQEGQEWVYDATTNRINLKRSGNEILPQVFYNEKGGKVVKDTDVLKLINSNSNLVVDVDVMTETSGHNKQVLNSKNISIIPSSSYRILNRSSLLASKEGTVGKSLVSGNYVTLSEADDTSNHGSLIGLGGDVAHHGTGNVKSLIGAQHTALALRGNVEHGMWGSWNEAIIRNDGQTQTSVKNSSGAAFRIYIQGKVKADNLSASNAAVYANDQAIATVDNVFGYFSDLDFKGTGNVINNLYGFKHNGFTPREGTTLNNNYGVYIGNVSGGSQKNYAIYTNTGKVHFGDEVNVAGSITATSIKGSNGATIFPDYVFQKYYTGTSSLKSDYSFKTLSQVEDFVKTNGHLPGYQSAAEIKKQGYIDLMATQLTNVEKIEELYLHSIEQDKALKAKEAKIAELEKRLEKLEQIIIGKK
ncbi:hypothetical protein PG630_09495, partial [Riemerella anatipestifer]|nr:hypothetical protein [Riemerella anatipestifer]